MPVTQLVAGADAVIWTRAGIDHPGQTVPGSSTVLEVPWPEVVAFESPLVGVLESGAVLTTAARLDGSAGRFAAMEVAAGWLKAAPGSMVERSPAEALEQVTAFEETRRRHVIAYVPEDLDYQESNLNPAGLQLVEGRSYQDAAVARVCNVPNFAVGVGVPNDSMTYKTAQTARYDLVDFGIAPYLECWSQTLSSDQVTPHGTVVAFDLEPFLRTADLARIIEPAPAPAPAAAGK
jgi:hypothetical protein